MKHFTYFAYGSNMLSERLRRRCPSAKAIGFAVASGYILKFSKESDDNSGKATLVVSTDPKRQVFGEMFVIENGDLCKLDEAEGKGKDYNRCDKFSVTVAPDWKQAQVTTYIASACAIDDSLKPYDWYLALAIAGALQHKLPETWIAKLREFHYIADPKPNRKTRKIAIGDLKLAGVEDFTQVLKSPRTH